MPGGMNFNRYKWDFGQGNRPIFLNDFDGDDQLRDKILELLTGIVTGGVAPDAVDVPFAPGGTIAATNVQDALLEVDSELAARIATQVADLVDSAPATLDTLNELAAALGDDPDFATTMTTALGTKLTQTQVLTLLEAALVGGDNITINRVGDTFVITGEAGGGGGGASTADAVSYDNTTSGLTAADVQAAIDEIAASGGGGGGGESSSSKAVAGLTYHPYLMAAVKDLYETRVGTWGYTPSSAVKTGGFLYNTSNAQNDSLEISAFLAAGTYSLGVIGQQDLNRAIQTWEVDDGAGGWTTIGTMDWYGNNTQDVGKTLTGIVVDEPRLVRIRARSATRHGASGGWYQSFVTITLKQTAATSVGGAGGTGSVLLENSEGAAEVPAETAVGSPVFRKAGGVETFDFRGASALPGGWSRRGIASETFDAAGMSAALAAGQGWIYTPPVDLSDSVTLEVRIITSDLSRMMGPALVRNADGNGVAAIGYNSPSGTLAIGVTNWQYGSNFADSGGSPAAPIWMRVVKVGTTVTAQYSTNGVTWSGSATRTLASTPDRIFIGNMINSAATMKIEQVRLTGVGQSSGLIGWWDGSDIESF